MPWAMIALAVGALASVSCGGDPACPLRCGDRCLAASACTPEVDCPADEPCDPCSGQCRAVCTPGSGCTDPALTCCGSGDVGVCVDVRADRTSCGACGFSCGTAGDRCLDGSCACGEVGPACTSGELCCQGGCVAPDAQNCAACGVACGPGETCDLTLGGCRCGSSTMTGASACGPGAACCGGGCTGITDDPANCGGCGLACAPGQRCIDGHCDCSTAGCVDPAQVCCTGLCAQVQTDPRQCGGCGVACGAGETCGSGACQCGATAHAGGPACAAGQTCCGTVCRDLASDAANCGGCGVLCGIGEACVGGKCLCGGGTACGAGKRCCAGACHTLSSDFSTCGSCTNACDAVRADACLNGGCVCSAIGSQCPAGKHCTLAGCVCDGTVCGGCCQSGSCVSPTSTASCGASGGACVACDTVRANVCTAGGTCGCSTNTGQAQCPAGKHCANAGCVCDGTVCAGGCCNGGAGGSCVPYASESNATCGVGGAACAACQSWETCNTSDGRCDCTNCDDAHCCGQVTACDGHAYGGASGDPVSGIQSTCKSDAVLPTCNSSHADGVKYFTSRGRVEACVSFYTYNGSSYNAVGFAYEPGWSSYSVSPSHGGCAADPYNAYDVCDAICAPVIGYKATCDATVDGNWNTSGAVAGCPANPCP